MAHVIRRRDVFVLVCLASFSCDLPAFAASPALEVRQITTGPLHHFFGYIGHVQNVPWNKSGRYVVALRTPVRDHLPDGNEPADIVLLDTANDFAARAIAQSRAWNPQQGTMLYWNPEAQETKLFFND